MRHLKKFVKPMEVKKGARCPIDLRFHTGMIKTNNKRIEKIRFVIFRIRENMWWTRYRFWKVNQLTLDWWLWLQTIWWRWIRIKTFSTPKRKSKLQQLTEWSINWLQFIGLPLLEIMLCWLCTPIKLICVKHSLTIWLAALKNIMIKITEIWLLQVHFLLVYVICLRFSSPIRTVLLD